MSARTVSVKPFDGDNLVYGFKTTVDQEVSTILGHKPVDSTTGFMNLVFGCNRPKPRRAHRFKAQKFESSFVDSSKVQAARTAGFSIGKAKPFGTGRTSTRSATYYVTINGIKYAWNLPTKTKNAFGTNLDGMGVKAATKTDDDLVFGASFPKPPKGQIETATGVARTYLDPTKMYNLPAGVVLTTGGLYEKDDIPF